jgi:hypothetical protein
MSSTVMMERTGNAYPGLGLPTYGTVPHAAPMGMMPQPSLMPVPRCTFKIEKISGGCRIICSCDDPLAISMVQQLCTMLAGGLCSCSSTCNGMTVFTCNFTMGLCRYEATDSGAMVTCTSGDQQCAQMIQSCCDCLSTLMDCGCTCCLMLNNMPVCCGTAEAGKTAAKSKSHR